MAKGFMFYDDEYANNDQRICSVGFVLRDFDGNLVGEPIAELIDPESEFWWACTKTHGLTAKDVSGCRNFEEFCKATDFLTLLKDYIFVAHNATGADLHHIMKSLAAYGLEMPEVQFIDTMAMSSNCLSLGKLEAVCSHYGVEIIKHHDALEDARACMAIFDYMVEEYGPAEPVVWEPGVGSYPKGKRPARVSEGGLGFVHDSDQSICDLLREMEALGLRGNPEDVELIEGLKLVVTGVVPGYKNHSIDGVLKAMRMKPSRDVGKKTELLVVGDNAGQAKINPAKKQGIPVITVHELLSLMES